MASAGRGLLARSTTAVALLATTGAVLALVAKLFLENRWTSLTCGDVQTLVLDRLLIASLACSALAVVAGITALACRTRHPVWVILTVLAAGMVAALILIPNVLGGYRCGITVA